MVRNILSNIAFLLITTVSMGTCFGLVQNYGQESDKKYTECYVLPLINVKNAVGTRWHLQTNVSVNFQANVLANAQANYFIITDAKQNKKDIIKSSSLFIYIDQSHFIINGIAIKSRSLLIESTDGVLHVNGGSYRGRFCIQVKNGITSLVILGIKEAQIGQACLIAVVDKQEHELDNNQDNENRDIKNKDSEEPTFSGEKLEGYNQDTDLLAEYDGLKQVKSFKIRVLLDQIKPETVLEKEISLFSESGFLLTYSGSTNKQVKNKRRVKDKQKTITVKEIFIKREHNQLYINNQKYDDTFICVMPIKEHLVFNGRPYQGSLLISQEKGIISFINSIDLEDYIFGVLRTESMPGWPLEIHKVFAVACRSYAIAMAIRAHKLKKVFHITNTNDHQTYAGMHTDNRLRQAVEETRGMFIAYNNEPIIAMYDICCGGIIPAHMSNFNFKNAPYLARSYACSYCKLCKPYSWEAVCTLKDFEGMVSQSIRKVKNIKSVTVSKKDKAGLVSEIVLKNSGRPITFSGKKMYSLMKNIKSFCFQAYKSGNSVVFKGKGYGHHVGLCQWGAREMVRSGWSYKKILEFYYPGTHFKRIG